ncbi:MAG TPA: ABC transporter permease subunit/CPBP intramembrane protease [Polyangia bacterium]|nr:ABC transporter permease subunit/CPBP intramembrane protease [Polyangia bacterium]
MKLHDVGVVVRKELRETLRDRRTLTVMLLFPLVVYPMISLLLAEVMAGKQADASARTSRVAVMGGDETARATLRTVLSTKGSGCQVVGDGIIPFGPGDITGERVDALVTLPTPTPRVAIPAQIVYDETRPASDQAHERVAHMLSVALPAGCAPIYAPSVTSLASKSKVGGYVLSKILPLIVVLMTMLGAFYPAIDITAGERERGTLETLLTSPVRRFDLMTGKVLAVATLAMLTGVLNIVSMSLTVAETSKLAAGGATFSIPWSHALATMLIVVPAAFLFASVMVAIGAMARSFKEAQTLLMPVYLLCFAPSLVASMAEFPLAGVVLLIPGTNLTLLARELMTGTAHLLPALVVLASTVGFGALALMLAARLYDSERLLASTDGETMRVGTWVRHLVGRAPGGRTPVETTAGHALALFGVAFVLWYFVFTWLQHWRMLPGLLLSQWGGFLGLVWLYARLTNRSLGAALVVKRPRGLAVLGATCVGLSGWLLLGVLSDHLMPPPRELTESLRRLIRPPGEDRPLWLAVFALGVTPAVCEEALFRGPILRGLRSRFSVPFACLLTGVLFGLLHGDIWRFLPTLLLGALLSWVALTSGSILPSMLAHSLNNSTLIVLGYYGWDQFGEHLSWRADLGLFSAGLVVFVAGIAALRKAGRQASNESRGTP